MHPTIFALSPIERENTLFYERVLCYPRPSLAQIYGTNQCDRQVILSLETYRNAAQMLYNDNIHSFAGMEEAIQKIRWICEISGDLDDSWYDRLIYRSRKRGLEIPNR